MIWGDSFLPGRSPNEPSNMIAGLGETGRPRSGVNPADLNLLNLEPADRCIKFMCKWIGGEIIPLNEL